MKKIKIFFSAVALFACIMASAQNITVKGVVTDASTGEPLPGAAILVKGGADGTVADINGNYSISVSTNATLGFTTIGYKSVEVEVNGRALINVALEADAELLDETIVVAYGTTTKASFTGSASVLDNEDMSSQRTSLVKSLDGKVAGVRVGAATGDPGADQRIQIRGIGSVNGSTQPLFVVDGVPISSDSMTSGLKSQSILATLNPDDIESMTVLKDAAAASLYGSRAANGVIIITTKKGVAGKTKITYEAEAGFSEVANQKALRMMTAEELKEYYVHAVKNYYEYYGETPTYEEAEADTKDFFWNYDNPANTDWSKEVYGKGFRTNHQVSISGGNDKTKFYASFGYNKDNGAVRGSNFERYSTRVNLDHQIYPWLKVGVRQMVSFTKTNGFRDQNDQSQGFGTTAPLSVMFSSDPTAAVRLPDGSWNNETAFGKVANPHIMMSDELNEYAEFDKSWTMRSLTNADVTVTLPFGLVAKALVNYDFTNNREQEFWAPGSVNGESLAGLGERYVFTGKTFTSSNTLSYNKSFGKNAAHNISAVAGFEVENRNSDYVYAAANNYATWKLPELSNGQMHGAGSSSNSNAMMSMFANVNYNFDNIYYLSGSFRRDGSSRLAKSNRWSNFWSVSAAWRLSNMDFLKGNQLFNDFKIRASYGTNGNLPSSYYAYQGLYSTSGGYGSNGSYVWSQLTNENLGWEKSGNFNIGIDWNLYGRVGLTVEYYNKQTKDLIFDTPSSYVTGFGSKTSNIGQINNSGVEIEINSINVKNKNFSWETSFNITFQKNIVKSLPGGEDVQYGDGEMYLLREGESMHTFYLPQAVGVNSETGLMEFWKDPEDHSKGVVTSYANAGKTIVGKAVPDMLGGMTNSFTFGNFDFSFMISYQTGASLFDYPGYFLQYSDGVRVGSFNMVSDVAGNYWKKPGDNAKYPKPIYGNPYRSDKFSSREIISSDNVRVRDITLGYNFKFKNSSVIDHLRLYLRASNPFMIYNAADIVDPDVDINGYRQTDTPPLRSFVFGVNVGF